MHVLCCVRARCVLMCCVFMIRAMMKLERLKISRLSGRFQFDFAGGTSTSLVASDFDVVSGAILHSVNWTCRASLRSTSDVRPQCQCLCVCVSACLCVCVCV
jgi:hypothetical protein